MTILEVDLILQLRLLQFIHQLKSHPIWREYLESDAENLDILEYESDGDSERKVRIDLHCRFLAECSRSPYRLN